MNTTRRARRLFFPVSLIVLASASALAGGCLRQEPSCPQVDPQEFCFAWPLPADGGTTGDPGPCPPPTSDEARLDVENFGKPSDGSTAVGEGVTVLGGGTLKNGSCCYQVQQLVFCE